MVSAKHYAIKCEMQQVVLTIKGDIPKEYDLRNLGTYKTRDYVPEPLRCYERIPLFHPNTLGLGI